MTSRADLLTYGWRSDQRTGRLTRRGSTTAPLPTKQKGQIALAKVLIEAAKKGAEAYLPTTQARCDLLLEGGGRFYRVQVKYADGKSSHSHGSVMLHLRRRKKCYTAEEIDVLLVYLPQLDKVGWFGPEVFHNKAALALRIKPAKNGQSKGCRMVDDFLWQRGVAQLGLERCVRDAKVAGSNPVTPT